MLLVDFYAKKRKNVQNMDYLHICRKYLLTKHKNSSNCLNSKKNCINLDTIIRNLRN